MAWLHDLVRRFRHGNGRMLRFGHDLRSLGVPLTLLVAMGLLLYYVDPAQDVLRNLADSANAAMGRQKSIWSGDVSPFQQWIVLFVTCVVTGISAWYWPLLLYKYIGGGGTGCPEPLWHHYSRRAMACVPLVIAMAAIFHSAPGTGPQKWADLWLGLGAYGVGLLLMLYFFVWRRRIIDDLARQVALPGAAPVRDDFVRRLYRALGGQTRFPLVAGESAFVAVTIGLAIVSMALFAWSPWRDALALQMGPAAIVVLAFGSLISVLSLLQWLARPLHIALPLTLALWAGFTSTFNDNNAVRALPDARVTGAPGPAGKLDKLW